MRIELTEQVVFNLKLTHEQSERNKNDVRKFIKNPPPTEQDDVLNLTYTLYLEYFGEVAERLEAIERLSKDGAVIGGSVDEINQGRILIFDVLKRLEKLTVKVSQ